MGNHRFMPFSMASKSWFSKLKHIVVKAHGSQPLKKPMEKKTPVQSPTQQEDFLQKRASQYIPSEERKENPPRCPINTKASDTHFLADLPPPRKSKRRPPRKVAAKPCTGAANSSCKSEAITPKKIKELEVTDAATSGCKYEATRWKLEAATSSCKPEVAPELKQLPPILTKAPALKKKEAANSTPGDESETARRRSVSVPGTHRIRVRRSSPRIESKKPQYASKLALQTNKKKKNRTTGLSESLVMIKSSSNPWRDFADSMLEMIVENDIRGAKDLEELLACYLSLNSKEYHEVIIKVFEHIWFALTDVRIM